MTCTACGDYQNGIQGSLSLGTSIGVAMKQKILGAQKTLWELSFYVGILLICLYSHYRPLLTVAL